MCRWDADVNKNPTINGWWPGVYLWRLHVNSARLWEVSTAVCCRMEKQLCISHRVTGVNTVRAIMKEVAEKFVSLDEGTASKTLNEWTVTVKAYILGAQEGVGGNIGARKVQIFHLSCVWRIEGRRLACDMPGWKLVLDCNHAPGTVCSRKHRHKQCHVSW